MGQDRLAACFAGYRLLPGCTDVWASWNTELDGARSPGSMFAGYRWNARLGGAREHLSAWRHVAAWLLGAPCCLPGVC
eukprot:355916-Chlamydomonas_euryale.AAC.3